MARKAARPRENPARQRSKGNVLLSFRYASSGPLTPYPVCAITANKPMEATASARAVFLLAATAIESRSGNRRYANTSTLMDHESLMIERVEKPQLWTRKTFAAKS